MLIYPDYLYDLSTPNLVYMVMAGILKLYISKEGVVISMFAIMRDSYSVFYVLSGA